MKNYCSLFFIFVTMLSCDPAFYHDFYIVNNCNETIEVRLYYNNRYAYPASGKPLTRKFTIEQDTNMLIGAEETIGVRDHIQYYFDSIIITKGEIISKSDYLDYLRWQSKKKSKYYTDSYLIITSEDFDNSVTSNHIFMHEYGHTKGSIYKQYSEKSPNKNPTSQISL